MKITTKCRNLFAIELGNYFGASTFNQFLQIYY